MNDTNKTKADLMFERFKRDYTVIAEDVVDYYLDGRFYLALEFGDGSVRLWSEFDRKFLPLPKNLDSMSDEQYRVDIGRRIYEVMYRKNVTQEKLSEMTGIAQQQLSRYISGRTMPNFRALDKITRALRMSLEELRNIDLKNDIDWFLD